MDAEAARNKNLKSPDVWLEKYTKYFLWPPAFGDQGGESQCLTSGADRSTDLFCSKEMRTAALRMGRPLPKKGCSTQEVLSWQVDDLREQVTHMRKAKGRRTG